MKSWLKNLGGKDRKPGGNVKRTPVAIRVASKSPMKTRIVPQGSRQMSPKKSILSPKNKKTVVDSTEDDSQENVEPGVSEKQKISSPDNGLATFGDWIRTAGIVSAVYLEPEVEDYEYGIFTFHFNSLLRSGEESLRSSGSGVPVSVVAKHMMEMQIFTKEEEALRFCKALAGDFGDILSSSHFIAEAKNDGLEAKKYTRTMCKRYVKAVYSQEIADILTKPVEDTSHGSSVSHNRPQASWTVRNAPKTMQRESSHSDQRTPRLQRVYSRQMSRSRDKVLHRMASRAASRLFGRQDSRLSSREVDDVACSPARSGSSMVFFKDAAVVRKAMENGANEDELTMEQRRQVEDFLRDNGYDEY